MTPYRIAKDWNAISLGPHVAKSTIKSFIEDYEDVITQRQAALSVIPSSESLTIARAAGYKL
jgi:hypothetical protein